MITGTATVRWPAPDAACGVAAILTASTPLFSAVLAHRLTHDEPLTARHLAGAILGLLGEAVMVGPEALWGQHLHVVAELAVLAAAVSCAGRAPAAGAARRHDHDRDRAPGR